MWERHVKPRAFLKYIVPRLKQNEAKYFRVFVSFSPVHIIAFLFECSNFLTDAFSKLKIRKPELLELKIKNIMDKDLFLINLVKRKVLSSLLIKTVVGPRCNSKGTVFQIFGRS